MVDLGYIIQGSLFKRQKTSDVKYIDTKKAYEQTLRREFNWQSKTHAPK